MALCDVKCVTTSAPKIFLPSRLTKPANCSQCLLTIGGEWASFDTAYAFELMGWVIHISFGCKVCFTKPSPSSKILLAGIN